MQTYHYGDIYCRFYFSFQRKAEQSFPFTKAKQARGFMSAKGQALRRFPINLPLASLRAYLSGNLVSDAPCKRAFENGTTAPPPTTDRKGKIIRWGYTGKQTAGTATAERQTDGTPQGIYEENTVAY